MDETIRVILILIAAMISGYIGCLIGLKKNVASYIKNPDISDVVRAKKFEIIDAKGKTRGSFDLTSGNPGIWLYDIDGNSRAIFCLDAKSYEPRISLFEADGKVRGTFRMAEGNPCLTLFDKNDKARSCFYTTDCESGIRLFDANGNKTWGTPNK